MNLKTLLGIGGIAWIAYILYKNNKQDMLIQEIKNELEDAKAKLEGAASQVITELPTKVKETFGMSTPNIDMQLFGNVKQSYNASKNATVAPAVIQVINEAGLPYEKFQEGM
jgi:uncharacterized protein YjbJ (UPF0337 family)